MAARKSKAPQAKPVLQWMLKESENDIRVLERTVEKWTGDDAETPTAGDVEAVTKGLTSVSAQIATADEHDMLLPQLPIIGRFLTNLISRPHILHANTQLHRNVIQCLINLNRTRPGAKSGRVKARFWAMRTLKSMCRLKNQRGISRQVGFSNSDLLSRMRRKVLTSLRRRLKNTGESDEKALDFLEQSLVQSDASEVKCLNDVISCIEYMEPSHLRTQLIERLGSIDEINAELTVDVRKKIWTLHPSSYEKQVIDLVEKATRIGRTFEESRVLIERSPVLEVSARDDALLSKLMTIVSKVISSNSSKFIWLPTLFLRAALRRNPAIELTFFPDALQSLVGFLSTPPERALVPLVVNSLHGIIISHLGYVRTLLLKYWFRDWYYEFLTYFSQKGKGQVLVVMMWLNGYLVFEGIYFDEILNFSRLLETSDKRLILNYLEKSMNCTQFYDFVCELVIVYVMNHELERQDPLVRWLERNKSGESVESLRKSLEYFKFS